MKILNLHGFLGIADNKNYYALCYLVPPESIKSPQMKYKETSPLDILNQLSEMEDTDDFLFVVQSLGGFFADILSRKFNRPCILTNPCYYPHELDLIYTSGISMEFLEQYRELSQNEKNILAFSMCSDHDTVLPENYMNCEKLSVEVLRVHGGHSTIDNIGEYFSDLISRISNKNQ